MSEVAELVVDRIVSGDSKPERGNLDSGDLVVENTDKSVAAVGDMPVLDSDGDLEAKGDGSDVSCKNDLGIEAREKKNWFDDIDVEGLRNEDNKIREEAWEAFYRKLHSYVSVRASRSGLGESDLADDITQVVADKILRFLLNPKNKDFIPYHFSGWVARITTNAIITRYQVDKKDPSVLVSDLGEHGEAIFSNLPDDSTVESEVLGALSTGDVGSEIRRVLTEEQMQVVELLASGDFDTQQEIADFLGVSLEVVKARLNRARERVNKYAIENPDSALGQYRHWTDRRKRNNKKN